MSRKNIIEVPCNKFDEARFSVIKEQFNLTDKKEVCNLVKTLTERIFLWKKQYLKPISLN